MTTTMRTLKPGQTTEANDALDEIATLLSHNDQALSLTDGQGGRVALPAEVVDAFSQVIAALQAKKPMVLYPKKALLTTQQAAGFLGVSRPYLIQLLDEGKIPHTMTGSHRRILYADLASYRAEMKKTQRAALEEIVRISEEAGLYDLE